MTYEIIHEFVVKDEFIHFYCLYVSLLLIVVCLNTIEILLIIFCASETKIDTDLCILYYH